MKSGWTEKKLGEVCVIKPPKSEARKKLSGSAIVSFAPMETLGIDQKYLEPTQKKTLDEVQGSYTYFADGDVLLAKITPCFENGKLGIAQGLENGIGFGSSEYIVFRSLGDVSPEFLYYYLLRPSFRDEGAKRMTGAVGHKRVAMEFIENTRIPLPPLAEQEQIVAILDEAFEGIATAAANAEKNLANARELFNSHLQFAYANGVKNGVKRLLGEICRFEGGSQPPKSVFEYEASPENIRLVQIRDYKSDKNIVFIPRKSARRFCNANDVMIGRYGPPVFQILRGIDGAYNVALMKAVANEIMLSKEYLFYFLKHPAIQEYVIYHSERASGQTGVNKEKLESYPILLPTIHEQQRVVAITVELESECQRLEAIYQQKLTTLDELKKSILHRAFSGQLH